MRGAAGIVVGLGSCFVSGIAVAQLPIDTEGGPPYLGLYELGLYRNGSNDCPEAHRIEGLARANAIVPLNSSGAPDPNGRIVMMSVGMSNATIPFCIPDASLPPRLSALYLNLVDCSGWSFMGRSRQYVALNPALQIVNGAYNGQPAENWDDDNFPTFAPIPPNPSYPTAVGNYDRVRDLIMPVYVPTVSEASVQVAWLKVLHAYPPQSLPGPGSDAEGLVSRMGNILRFMRTRYPNLSIVFLTPSTYRGYHTTAFNPEPQGHEGAFAVKWLIEAQVAQIESGNTIIDPLAGDLDYTDGTAPWVAWGPYLWANGTTSRASDGLSWASTDYAGDGLHHTPAGLSKFGLMLLHFFTQNRFSHCWFIGDGACE
jgi:hypothetical protein